MNKINYNKVMEETIEKIDKEGKKPRLLLQVCCGPCSTLVIERLKNHFDMDLYFYNPMIYPRSELDKRAENLKIVAEKSDFDGEVIIPANDIEDFNLVAQKRKDDKEFGRACYDCYELRLAETCRLAKEKDFWKEILLLGIEKQEIRNNIDVEVESLSFLEIYYGYSYMCMTTFNGYDIKCLLEKFRNLYSKLTR